MHTLKVLIAVCCVSCTSATIKVERRASGAAERDFEFTPKAGLDGHFITFPAYPLSNCLDVVQADDGKHDVMQGSPKACSNSKSLADFLGYWSDDGALGFVEWIEALIGGWKVGAGTTWVTEQSSLRQAVPMACQLGLSADTRPTPLLSFVQLSDVQIREPGAKLGGTSLSHQLDPIITSFERGYEQELYSMYVYAGVVSTINAEVRRARVAADPQRPAPAFMIHTGDAVDAGLRSEFTTFRDVSDRLVIPWYSVIGNHDVLAFGNLQMKPSRHANGREACMEQRRKLRATLCAQDAEHRWWQGQHPDAIDSPTSRVVALDRCPKEAGKEAVQEDGESKWTKNEGEDRSLCQGGPWEDDDKHPCTCTRISDLLREEVLIDTPPDNTGKLPNIPTSKRLEMIIPGAIQRVCLQHEVEADAFVMDPNLMTSENTCHSPATAFIEAHCNQAAGQVCQKHLNGAGYANQPLRDDKKSGLYNGIEYLCGTTVHADAANATALHGYDLDAQRRGYYCFEAGRVGGVDGVTERRIWAVALDTASEVGAYGEVDDQQLSWLTAVLRQVGKTDLVLVFAHHPVYDIYDPSHRNALVDLLTEAPQVVGYFAGHTHSAANRVIHPRDEDAHGKTKRHHVWEIVAPSLIGYPQQGRLVTIKTIGQRLGYFEIVSFSPAGNGDGETKIELARASAQADVCNEPRGCIDGKPPLPSRSVSFSRLFFQVPEHARHAVTPLENGCTTIHKLSE